MTGTSNLSQKCFSLCHVWWLNSESLVHILVHVLPCSRAPSKILGHLEAILDFSASAAIMEAFSLTLVVKSCNSSFFITFGLISWPGGPSTNSWSLY